MVRVEDLLEQQVVGEEDLLEQQAQVVGEEDLLEQHVDVVGEEGMLKQQLERIGVWPDVALLGDGRVLDELVPWGDEGADGGHVEVVIERGYGVGGGETLVWPAGIQD